MAGAMGSTQVALCAKTGLAPAIRHAAMAASFFDMLIFLTEPKNQGD
jgi:hypothetical protein